MTRPRYSASQDPGPQSYIQAVAERKLRLKAHPFYGCARRELVEVKGDFGSDDEGVDFAFYSLGVQESMHTKKALVRRIQRKL